LGKLFSFYFFFLCIFFLSSPKFLFHSFDFSFRFIFATEQILLFILTFAAIAREQEREMDIID
jgi:hypothetical protein